MRWFMKLNLSNITNLVLVISVLQARATVRSRAHASEPPRGYKRPVGEADNPAVWPSDGPQRRDKPIKGARVKARKHHKLMRWRRSDAGERQIKQPMCYPPCGYE